MPWFPYAGSLPVTPVLPWFLRVGWGPDFSPQSVTVEADVLPVQPSFDTVSLTHPVPDWYSGSVYMAVSVNDW